MLLACLQGQSEAGIAVQVGCTADNAPGHLPDMVLLAGHEAEVRAARRHRYAQRLAFAAGNIGAVFAPLTGRPEQRQRGRVDDTNQQRALCVGPVCQAIHIIQRAGK